MTDTPDLFSPVVYRPFAGRPDDDDTLDMKSVRADPLLPMCATDNFEDFHAMRTTDTVQIAGV